MNGLYPIIRRKRRPLIVVDAKPVEPVKVDPAPPAKPETKTEPSKPHDENNSEQNVGPAA
jgi:hypothetical protein